MGRHRGQHDIGELFHAAQGMIHNNSIFDADIAEKGLLLSINSRISISEKAMKSNYKSLRTRALGLGSIFIDSLLKDWYLIPNLNRLFQTFPHSS